jgi:hypothetical protein
MFAFASEHAAAVAGGVEQSFCAGLLTLRITVPSATALCFIGSHVTLVRYKFCLTL